MVSIVEERAEFSRARLDDLKRRLAETDAVAGFPRLTIFGAGSYARLEASEFSDIDLFFLVDTPLSEVTAQREQSLRLFSQVLRIAVDDMKFPRFSNDCEYLNLISAVDILRELGSPTDDFKNHFTARMLMLLESQCLYGNEVFDGIIAQIVQAYFKDYPDHPQSFLPTFLINDISRYWKTILLNYENKRPADETPAPDEVAKLRQKVRNYKLKYSRMTTCFATVAALASYDATVTEADVVALTKLTVRDRLNFVRDHVADVHSEVDEVLAGYASFLEFTGLPTEDLENHFSDREKRTEMFDAANAYGDAMFRLFQKIDAIHSNTARKVMRYLVI